MKLCMAFLCILLGIVLISITILLTNDIKSMIGGIVLLGIGIKILFRKPKVAKQNNFEKVIQNVRNNHSIKL